MLYWHWLCRLGCKLQRCVLELLLLHRCFSLRIQPHTLIQDFRGYFFLRHLSNLFTDPWARLGIIFLNHSRAWISNLLFLFWICCISICKEFHKVGLIRVVNHFKRETRLSNNPAFLLASLYNLLLALWSWIHDMINDIDRFMHWLKAAFITLKHVFTRILKSSSKHQYAATKPQFNFRKFKYWAIHY